MSVNVLKCLTSKLGESKRNSQQLQRYQSYSDEYRINNIKKVSTTKTRYLEKTEKTLKGRTYQFIIKKLRNNILNLGSTMFLPQSQVALGSEPELYQGGYLIP